MWSHDLKTWLEEGYVIKYYKKNTTIVVFIIIFFLQIRYVGRDTLAAPAVGVGKWHQKQAEDVINDPFNLKI